jgi:3-methylfumaryl-CoA hydratase
MSAATARPVLETELLSWRDHVGRRKVQRVVVDAEVLRRFAFATGADPNVERAAPMLGHWALFLDAVAGDSIGADGHPLRGDFLPAVHLPRRMFAAAAIRFEAPLQIGAAADCTATIAAVNHKRGQAGDLVFVEVEREIAQAGVLRVRERQTIVYREAGEPQAPVLAAEPSPGGGAAWCPGPVDLFRFSAVTFNSHRIHYDQQYARTIEGYPDLVVHGPFTAIKLLDYACAGRTARSFEFRGAAPLFASQPVRLAAGPAPGSFEATRCDGIIAMTAKVEFQ